MNDELDRPTADDQICPYCRVKDDCEHLLLLVDLTFRSSEGGALQEAFSECWGMYFDQDGDFDERETFSNLLEEIDAMTDMSSQYVIEGGPGMTSEYAVYHCKSRERVAAAMEKFGAR